MAWKVETQEKTGSDIILISGERNNTISEKCYKTTDNIKKKAIK